MDDLKHYFSSTFDKAEKLHRRRRTLQFGLFLISVTTPFLPDIALYFAALILFLSQLISWIMKIHIQRLDHIAHQLQRNYMLHEYLGSDVDFNEITNLKHKLSPSLIIKIAKKIESSISDTKQTTQEYTKGTDRLKHEIHASVFYNKYLYKHTYNRNLYITITLFILIFVACISFLPYADFNSILTWAKIFFIALSFSPIYEFLESTLKYRETAEIMNNLENFLSSNKKTDEELITDVFSKYNEAKLITPNIPLSIFNKYKKRLETDWAVRCTMNKSSRT